VADVEELFGREVIDDFLAEYQKGRTPNPCVQCNTIVRFRTLIDHADKLGLEYVATGHYARIFESEEGNRYLARSINRSKDQSYFLSGVRGETLERVLFPLGDLGKETVRGLARDASLSVADKSESQEVCFVPEGTLKAFLESHHLEFKPGKIEDLQGKVIGEHHGLAGFTVGQRRHLGIATGTPRYVVRLDNGRNVLVVGDDDDLLERTLCCTLTWIDPSVVRDPTGVTAQIRYRHTPARLASVHVEGNTGHVEFEEPQRAICPGQTIALFKGDIVVGSGVIDETSL